MRRLQTFLLIASSLGAAACTGEAGSSADGASDPYATTHQEELAARRDGAAGAATNKGAGLPAQDPAVPSKPKRTPQFNFAPGGVPDAELGNYHVVMEAAIDDVSVGTMTFDFWPEKAPLTVRNFLRYCDEGFYDGLTYHRIVRDFMLQGGDPTASGAGDGPYGNVPAEFSPDPEWAHHYGVLSMARGPSPNSASCQFFLICDESPNVWNLDGDYASFGRMTAGVATLEKLASVPVGPSPPRGERSRPLKKVTIVSAVVKAGPAPPSDEVLARPAPDLGGAPAEVTVQHVLVSFAGTRTEATRTKEEAAALAKDVLERARAGEDFQALIRAHSDDPVSPDDPTPGEYRMLNRGVKDAAADRALFEAQKEFDAFQEATQKQIAANEISAKEAELKSQAFIAQLRAKLEPTRSFPRAEMAPSFGDVGFSLKVGEIGMAEYDPRQSQFGWHIIKRIR
ncbi:MAG TPA: peptidylprolyl isomerase [Planctomycetota bacterium]